jgi:mannosyltransferase OCH1-like enzyme
MFSFRKKILKNNKTEKKEPMYPLKNNYNSIIPLNIFQTWHTKNLPPKMLNSVQLIRRLNPRFNYFLFDDNDSREFIKNNFENDVLNAYDSLIPGAYKADLWRYCILYKLGGIYIDIKYKPYNGFRFINLTEKEHLCLDIPNQWDEFGVYNAIMVCLPENKILLKLINHIVKNVENNYYGDCYLDPTGPTLVSKYYTEEEKKSFDLKHIWYAKSFDDKYVIFNNYKILECYEGYTEERDKYSIKQHYGNLWRSKNIYIKNNIIFNIC